MLRKDDNRTFSIKTTIILVFIALTIATVTLISFLVMAQAIQKG